jgi:hypothetical protein
MDSKDTPMLTTEVTFPVHKLLTSTTVWVDPAYPAAAAGHAAFNARFAYAIADNHWLEALQFDRADRRLYQAERYGGAGIGDNGGGVRVGNFDGYQIKGIGKNPLGGSGANLFHTYGALNALEALYEAIYSVVLNRLLPLGAASVHGVIVTGARSAYVYFDEQQPEQGRCWGALLVREVCRRPSHYMRAGRYTDAQAARAGIAPDVARVRAACKTLANESGGNAGLVNTVRRFLQGCAHQFAFARIARLAHGALSPSNLGMDGRWLDLASTTFVRGGEDSGFMVSFYREPEAVQVIAKELIDGLAKYNKFTIDVAALLEFYRTEFAGCLAYHACYLFGLRYEQLSGAVRAGAHALLTDQVNRVIGSAQQVTIPGFPDQLSEDDPVIALIEGLFLSLGDGVAAHARLAHCHHVAGFRAEAVAAAFGQIVHSVSAQAAHGPATQLRRMAISAMKRAWVPGFYMQGRLGSHIKSVLTSGQVEDFGALVASASAIAEWAFAHDDGPQVWIFRGAALEISYLPNDACFAVRGDRLTCLPHAAGVRALLATQAPDHFCICGFSFQPYIERLFRILESMETSPHA